MDSAPRRVEKQRPAIEGGEPVRRAGAYLVFGAPRIEEPEIAEVVATLRSGWIGTGPKVERFQRDFAAYLGAENVVAVASCSAALHLSLAVSGIGPGDEVITTPLTFCATLNAILHAGATPVLADCDPRSMNLDPACVERRLTPRTRAILPVHFAGRCCDMQSLGEIARRHGLLLIEDCAHAIETLGPDGRHAGTTGQLGAFSFYVTKNLTTAEGGMVVASDAETAARIQVMALHGLSKDAWMRYSDDGYRHYEVVGAGFKYNMTDIQASLGIHQLAGVELRLQRREAIWSRYDEAFADLPLERPAAPEAGTRHARHLYTLLVDEARCGISRDRFVEALHAEGIGTGIHYRALSEHDFYRRCLDFAPEHVVQAEHIGRCTLSLPLSAALGNEDVEDVVTAVRKIAAAYGPRRRSG